MSRTRIFILFGIKSFFSLIALFLVTAVIHEGAHYITAVILRVPVQSFTLFDPHYFAPVFISGATKSTIGYKVVSYAGGLVTGVLLLAILLLKKEWFKQTLYRWLLGFYIVTFGFWQICQGILEGAFHETYIANANNFFGSTYYIGYASAFLGMAIYWLLMHRLKNVPVYGG